LKVAKHILFFYFSLFHNIYKGYSFISIIKMESDILTTIGVSKFTKKRFNYLKFALKSKDIVSTDDDLVNFLLNNHDKREEDKDGSI